MNKGLKVVVASAAFGALVAAAPLVDSFAEEVTQVELQDGTVVHVEGKNVSVVNEDGTTSPAPDGEHVAKDGSTIVTKDGMIVEE